jgi:hypothetical protein
MLNNCHILEARVPRCSLFRWYIVLLYQGFSIQFCLVPAVVCRTAKNVFIVFITFLAVLHTTAGTRQNWILNPWYNKTIYQRNNEHLGTLASRIWQLLSMCISNTLYVLYRIYFHTAKNTVYYIYLCPDTYLSLLLKLKKKIYAIYYTMSKM